jgi:DMSO/TMAO reductase YedYZ heme-binding membrane subunit
MNSTALWYASQATGIVALVLFTLVMLLGTGVAGHGRLPGLPRFGLVALHRSISLLALAFLAVHIGTAVLDTYVDIPVAAVFVPFASTYQSLWIALGAVALDLMLALLVSSLLRARMNPRAWRAVHWLAYACWPLAIAHTAGIGAGRGSAVDGWELWLTLACVAAVAAGLAWRIAVGLGRRARRSPAEVFHTSRGTSGTRSGVRV